jgi:hypothetical protein
MSPPSSGSKNNLNNKPAWSRWEALITPCFMLVSCLAYSSAPKMEALYSSETSDDFQRTTRRSVSRDRTVHHTVRRYIQCSLRRLIGLPDTGISRQTEGRLFGDHLISDSVSVTPSSVIEASIVFWSASLWLVWVSNQPARWTPDIIRDICTIFQ